MFRFKNVDHLKSEGDMEKNTEYNDRINTAARRGDPRARYRINQDLITPYGNFASSAIRLGDPKRYKDFHKSWNKFPIVKIK